MNITKTFYAADRDEWRAWLAKHHRSGKEIWLVYYKKHTKRPTVSYNDAVEEALCFGWIDSTVKRIDDQKYAQKFTPRKDHSNWSEPNKKRLRKLIAEGKMMEAGLACVEDGVLSADETGPKQKGIEFSVPQYFTDALTRNQKARSNFNNLAPSYRKLYVRWVADAKREETRTRRLKEAIGLLARNKKLGLK
jgi:uncharacterized protein YdeI (YjbR/CyaY-like superfamily)